MNQDVQESSFADVDGGSPLDGILAPPTVASRLVGALLVTHDLSAVTLLHEVAPRLLLADEELSRIPVTHTDRRAAVAQALVSLSDQEFARPPADDRPDAAPTTTPPRLVVLHAGHRLQHPTVVPRGIDVVVVGGRLLHAKFGVVVWRLPGGDIATSAYVTSANLTGSGLFSNIEATVVPSDPKEHCRWAAQLIEEASTLVPGHPATKAWLGRLHELVGAAGTPSGAADVPASFNDEDHAHRPPSELHSTIRQEASLVDRLAGNRSWPSVTIVSPSFARSPAVAAEMAAGVVEKGAGINLVLSSVEASERWSGSKLGDELTAAGLDVTLRTVGSSVRRLHAKVYAFVDVEGGAARMAVGSGNLTSSGLGGCNRELFVAWDLSPADVEAHLGWLGDLHEWPGAGSEEPDDRSESPVGLPPAVSFTFEVISGSSPNDARGILRAEGLPDGWTLDGATDGGLERHLARATQPVRLVDPNGRSISLTAFAVTVDPGPRPEFWNSSGLPTTGAGVTWKSLQMLLGLDLLASRPAMPWQGGVAGGLSVDDVFRLPLEDRPGELANLACLPLDSLAGASAQRVRELVVASAESNRQGSTALDVVDALLHGAGHPDVDPPTSTLGRLTVKAVQAIKSHNAGTA